MSILDSLRPISDLRVLVTAGASGVGAAIACAFNEVGARVHVCDIDRSALDRLNAEAPNITGSMADVAVAADVDRVFDDVEGTLGGLDVLVNNAGIPGPTGGIDSIDLELGSQHFAWLEHLVQAIDLNINQRLSARATNSVKFMATK